MISFSFALLNQGASAEDNKDNSPDLKDPPVCSPLKPISPKLKKYNLCEITTLPVTACNKILTQPGRECHKIKVNLTANTGEFEKTGEIEVGGYKVKTEHYNDSYLTPVIEALPGDTVAVHLLNALPNRTTQCMMVQGATDRNPTNLHYFHGGIVSPNNAIPEVEDARQGTGDNMFVYLKNGADSKFDLEVSIPGEGGLDGRVLESPTPDGKISHPVGLNWYHSHLHCLSSDQVMGGMSGLLSVGEDKANVKAKCASDMTLDRCKEKTDELKGRTIVKYAMLRDITLKDINASPTSPTEPKTATWDPDRERNSLFRGNGCRAPGEEQPNQPKPELRKGFCQREQNSAWLFTLNGQRFPTITIKNEQNLLLRLGNLSSNVAYWLELDKVVVEGGTEKLELIPLTILSLDGVVPALPERPVDSVHPKIPVDAVVRNDLLLMPASRAEIYIRNDEKTHSSETYVLRTKGLSNNVDQWPEIWLARIKLEPSRPAPSIPLALNVPIEEIERLPSVGMFATMNTILDTLFLPTPRQHSAGCIRDLKSQEFRRVTFQGAKPAIADKLGAAWGIKTEIVREPDEVSDLYDDSGGFSNKFKVEETETVDASFEQYELDNGELDWEGVTLWEGVKLKHVCVRLDNKENYKQLWVIHNATAALHNFHIHQMKFRLAKEADLTAHHINVPKQEHTCGSDKCDEPDYQLYDANPDPKLEWHDTMPVQFRLQVPSQFVLE